MNKEPLAVTTVIRVAIYQMVVGFQVFGVATFTNDQFAWLIGGAVVIVEAVMWLITRNEVWAPGGAPTHPETERLWSEKLAAEKSEWEALFVAPGHTATAPSFESEVAMVDNINPGSES